MRKWFMRCCSGEVTFQQVKRIVTGGRMYVENASRASKQGLITPENLEPNPKNPIISAFFRNIGRADRLGSGVRNLYKYSKYYSGEEPSFMEGDVFRIVVLLNDAYSFDFGASTADKKLESADKVPINADKKPESADKVPISVDKTSEDGLSMQQKSVLEYVRENRKITSHQAELLLQVKQRRARVILGEMVDAGLLEKQGAYKTTVYTLK